jgi:uncharacterized protein YbjT (DUF2867 family)
MTERLEKSKILVTCATGTVGGEVKQLVSLPSSDQNIIRAAVHSQADKFNQYKTVEIVSMDYSRSETVVDALSGVN